MARMCDMWDVQKGKPGVYRSLTSRPKSFCRNRRIPPCSGPKGTCETNRLSQKPKPGMKQTQGNGIVTTTVSNMYINIPNKLNYQLTNYFFLQGKYPLPRGQRSGMHRRPEQHPELYPSGTQITPKRLTYHFFVAG